jgi:hypothetical protein
MRDTYRFDRLLVAWTLSILVVALTGAAPAASVYRWVDERGRVHYTDRPPSPDAAPEPVKIAPRPAEDPELSARRERQRRFLDAIEEDRTLQRAEAEARREEARRQAANCQRVQRSLRQFELGGALYLEEENGDRRYLDDDERARSLAELQRLQRTWCGR